MITDPTKLKAYGLVPATLPRKHPTTHQVFGSVEVANLLPRLILPDTIGPTDQGDTQFCFDYCIRQLCSDMDALGIYDLAWGLAMVAKTWGQSPLNGAPALEAMQSMVEYGPLLASLVPSQFKWDPPTQPELAATVADPKNWPTDLFEQAAPHEKVSVLSVDGPYDDFDNVRSAIQMHNRHVAFATKWYYQCNTPDPATGIIPPIDPTSTSFSWHMYEAMDFDTLGGVEVIRVKPHEGASYGVGGYGYLTRENTNALIEDPQAVALMFGDVPASLLSRLMLQNQSLEDIFTELRSRIEANL